MGKKLIEELREKVRKKHESVIEESKKVTETLRTLEKLIAGIDATASAAANSLLKERNKEKVKGRYTEVMQRLEHCYNELFLINSSLPGNTEEEGDSSSSSDSDGEDPVGGATSTPHTSHHGKPDLSPSFIPDTSSQFTLRDQSKLGLTAIFKDEQAPGNEESAADVKQHQTAGITLECSMKETTVVKPAAPQTVCVLNTETLSAVQAEESQSASTIKSEMGQADSEVKAEESEPAPVPRAEVSQPAPVPRAEVSQPAPVPRAEVSQPAPVPRAEVSQPAPVPRAEVSQPAPVPKAEVSQPAPVPRAEVSQPAPVPRAEVSQPAPVPKAEVSQPAPVPTAEVSQPAPVPTAEVSQPAPVPTAEVSQPAPVPRAEVSQPAPVTRAEVSQPAPVPRAEVSQPAPVPRAEVSQPPSPVEAEGYEDRCAVEAVDSLPVSAVKVEEEIEDPVLDPGTVNITQTVNGAASTVQSSGPAQGDNMTCGNTRQAPPVPVGLDVHPVLDQMQGKVETAQPLLHTQLSEPDTRIAKPQLGGVEPQSQVLEPHHNIKTEPIDQEQRSAPVTSQPQPQMRQVSDTPHGTKTGPRGGEDLAELMSQCTITSPRQTEKQFIDTRTEIRYPVFSIPPFVNSTQRLSETQVSKDMTHASPVEGKGDLSKTDQPKAATSYRQISETDDSKTQTNPKDAHISQTDLPRAESPGSDRSDTHSVRSDKVHPRRPKRVLAKAPSTKKQPSSRASSVAGDALELCSRIPPMEIIPDKEYGVVIQVVESPWLLWVQPFSEDFDDLIDSMSSYYEHLGSNDVRRNLDGAPVVGMYVCSRYSANGDWYRAMVTHIYQRQGEDSRSTSVPKVRVFYIDFGNSEDRNVEDLRPLLKKFAELPTHAVPCTLAEVAPLVDGDQWTKNESLAILLTLKSNESVGLKHAVFSYEPGSPLWFVHIYVPQAVPRVHIQARSGPITQEMICVSEHLVNNKLARRLPNAKVVKHIKQMKVTESVSDDARYVVASRMEVKKLILMLSPVNPESRDPQSSIKPSEGKEGRESSRSSADSPVPSNRGDVKQAQTKSGSVSPDVSENPKNLTRSKYSPRQDKRDNRSGESQSALYQEWAQAWKKVSNPDKDKAPAVRCSTSLTSTARNQDDTKSSPQNETKSTKTDVKNSDKESQGSRPPARRPASDHQHVHIPLAEISVGENQRVTFLMSHIESPGVFFIHPVAEETQQQIDVLAEQLEEYYGEANLTTMQRYFHSGNLEVHDACVAFYSEDNSYYRAEILNTSRPTRTSSVSGDSMSSGDAGEQVEVLYVDYGNREWVSLNKVYPIQPKLSAIPAQAVCCTLSHVKPMETDGEVTLSYDLGGWTKEAVHWFTSNTGYVKHFVGTVEETSGTKKYSLTDPLPMLLVDESHSHGPRCFNLELARLGMARITELPQMDQLNMGSPQKPNAGSPTELDNSAVDEWRPMEEDYLSMRNSYLVDTEDAGVALTGHKSVGDRTICRYYARGMRCWLGALCRDKHVRTNPEVCEDQVPAVVMYSDENLVQLPESNTWVRLEVLSVINPSRFYAYLPYGVLPIHADIDEAPATQEFLKLRDTMTEFYEEHPFEHQDLTLYAEGEIVAAKWEDDHYWYRSRVIEVDPDNEKVKVFFLDFGNAVWQKERHVKQIDTQFLTVPFQAVECHLEIKPMGEAWTTQAINEFVRFVDGKELVARVIERLGSRLTVDLNDTSDEKGEVNVADRFIHLGHARRVIPPNQQPSSGSTRNKRYRMVPG